MIVGFNFIVSVDCSCGCCYTYGGGAKQVEDVSILIGELVVDKLKAALVIYCSLALMMLCLLWLIKLYHRAH